jgi:hypothetical protein
MDNTEEWLVETNPDSLGWTSQSHPSFGVIGVSRVSGQASLFDSDVKHGHFIEITISEAKKHRTGFTHEAVMSGKELAKVRMSFAQFAQFITTQNVGSGTPCTIARVIGDEKELWATQWGGRPDPPDPKPFIDKFHAVGKERVERILTNIDSATEMMKKLFAGEEKPTKANLKTAVDAMASARQDVQSNLPYLMECLDGEMEHKLANAVTEFESYVSGSLQDKGLEVLREHTMKLNIGTQKSIGTGE